jgi:serine phosphatase RsbU (regulator of sigma subunit)
VTACVATGGHPLPLVLRDDGRVETAGRPGTLLGILPDSEISVTAIDLGPGDALILYTDGVIEASPIDDAFGPAPFASFVAGCVGEDASAIARRIEEAALEIQGGTPRDDVAVVVMRVSSGREGRFDRAGAWVAAGP